MPNPANLKTIGGIVAAGSVGTAGYIYRGPIFSFLYAEYQTYLVQVKTNADSTYQLKTGYLCSFTADDVEQKDDECELFNLGLSDQKYVDGNTVNKTTDKISEVLKEKNFYKLSVNIGKISEDFLNKEISLKKNDKDSGVIATLTVLSLINDKHDESSFDTWSGEKLLVKADSSVFESSALTSIKCHIPDNTNTTIEINCKIYEFNDAITDKHYFDFSKIKKLTNIETIQSGKYYVVDFSDEATATTKNKVKSLTAKSKITIKSDTTEKVKMSFVSKIFATLEDTPSTSTNNQGVIFSKDFGANSNNSTYIIGESVNNSGGEFNAKDKNYSCKATSNGSEKDTTCSIVELTDNDKTLKAITAASKQTDKDTLKTAGKYFKVTANNKVIQPLTTTWDGEQKFKIINTTTDTQDFGELKALFLIESGKVTKGKSVLAVTTFKQEGSDYASITMPTTDQTYKCQIGSSGSAEDCEIYKLPVTFNTKNPYSAFTSDLQKSNDKADWVSKSSFLIHAKGSTKFDASSMQNTEVTVTVESDSKKLCILKIDALAFNQTTFDGKVEKLSVLA